MNPEVVHLPFPEEVPLAEFLTHKDFLSSILQRDEMIRIRDGVNALKPSRSRTGGVDIPDIFGKYLDASWVQESLLGVERPLLWRFALALARQRAALLRLNVLAMYCDDHEDCDGSYDAAVRWGHTGSIDWQIVVDEDQNTAYLFTTPTVMKLWERDPGDNDPYADSFIQLSRVVQYFHERPSRRRWSFWKHTPEGDAFIKRYSIDYLTLSGIVTEAIPVPQPVISSNPREKPVDMAAIAGIRRPSNIKSSFANSSMVKLLKPNLGEHFVLVCPKLDDTYLRGKWFIIDSGASTDVLSLEEFFQTLHPPI